MPPAARHGGASSAPPRWSRPSSPGTRSPTPSASPLSAAGPPARNHRSAGGHCPARNHRPAGRGGRRDAPPVVLLHGFIDNRSVFVVLRRALTRHGHRHLEVLNYSPLTRDICTAAELLGRHVEDICERTGHSRVDVVGHSLGGLIARYYVKRLGGDRRVRTLVTLGTPHALW